MRIELRTKNLELRTQNLELRTKNAELRTRRPFSVLRSAFCVLSSAFFVLSSTAPAFAQLDPLLFLKNQQPNIIIAVDVANRMQRDADSIFYDPGRYNVTGAGWESTIGLAAGEAASFYRRKYTGLVHTDPVASPDDRFDATRIDVVGDQEVGYSTFYERTRLAVARLGIIQAIRDNLSSARFGLIRMRQTGPKMPTTIPNEGPVRVSDATQQSPAETGNNGKWKITRSEVNTTNSTTLTSGALVLTDAAGSSNSVISILEKNFAITGDGLIAAGRDGRNVVDAPVGFMLDDARAEAVRLIAADTSGCRNTAVVLVVGGKEGTIDTQNLLTKADTFLNVSGRRVPVYVVAIAPLAADVADLQEIARRTGGRYFEITKAMIEATAVGQPIPEMVRAVNTAVQHTFASSTDFNTAPTASLPYGPLTDFQVTSPVVGTVNLKGASRFNPTTGAVETLPDSETEVFHTVTGVKIPLRSNVLVTSAFALPGFDAKLRALRVYRPVPDTTKPSGYRFTQDGSRLWTASTPAAASRNIYTVLPGTGVTIKFDAANLAALSPYLGVSDPLTLIDWIRNQPLGAVVGSTPAFADPPSLDPPPDAAYPSFVTANKGRRSLIYVGLNDGMLHAIDSRTGVEVWAFIPFNLLPKLKALRFGQSLDAFKYFVDSSPKIADVKIGASWRTYLFFGQGPGGTYYNTLDITLDNISTVVSDISTDTSALVTYFSVPDRITWEWSFPRNTMFDHTIAPYGDVSATADANEKSVGETWSDPAIGQITNESGPYAMLVGSGFLRRSVENQANRAGVRAGRAFYVLDVTTGAVLASRDVGADTNGEDDDSCRAANNCTRIKNALQMDPVATGPSDSRFVSMAYIGDLDGKVWRFDMSWNGTSVTMTAPVQLYDAGAAHPLFASMATVNVGGSKQYIFVGTGSDLLPSNGVNQSYGLLVLLDNGGSATKTAEVLLAKTDGAAPDEKVTAFPAVAGDIVFFATTSINPAAPCSPFTANLYAFTFVGGPAYDTNNDGTLTATPPKKGGGTADSTKVFSTGGARATSPFIVDQHLVFAAGGKLDMFGDPDDFNNGVGQAGVRILSWRLVK
jgi:hypothetical protein